MAQQARNLCNVFLQQVCTMIRQNKSEPDRLPHGRRVKMDDTLRAHMAVKAMTAQTIKFIRGDEACAEGALYAGVNFCSVHPGTPSMQMANLLAERIPGNGGKFVRMQDESASMCAATGASLAGHKAFTVISDPGFSINQKFPDYAAMSNIPCVVINLQRGARFTGISTPTYQGRSKQARWGISGDQDIVVLTASNHQDLFTMTVEAFNVAEIHRTAAVLLLDEAIGKMRRKISIPWPGAIPLVDRHRTSLTEGEGHHPLSACQWQPGSARFQP